MRSFVPMCALLLCLGIAVSSAQQKETKVDTASAPIPAEDAAKKNPVPVSPEGLASAKKLYGYHCAMCHGEAGDGKGDLAAQMKLDLHDWRDPATLTEFTDGELFYIITNGRGKMTGGEGDRTKEEVRWNLVSLVRSFAPKKSATDTAKP